ncbi:hypothetical protein QJS10_CPA02g00900 [Acorus calamus]|uniref:DUF4283 domain-containing protein n=1 Tax=Acorus calamus TaxID=4465 RepID=A0AAV9FCR6_ACOCL|nr:hypothetical protein QJS10_CPA02g00900 [Acorus calamus]
MCGWRTFFVRLPTWAARDLILMENKLHVEGGVISFSKSDFSDMGVGGCQWQVLLRGLPVVWRTEGVLRKVVEPFGYLLNYVEILECEEISPPVKVTVWIMKEDSPPPLLEVVLGGMEAKVQVEVVHTSRTRSYAETVKFGPKVVTRWVPVGGGPGDGAAAGVSVSPGELLDAELEESSVEEAVQSAMEPGLPLVPFSEETGDRLDLGSPLLREGPRRVVVEPGAAEFLGSPGCDKASQIEVILQNEGERFLFKSFLYKSREDSSVTIPRRNQQENHNGSSGLIWRT